MLSRCCPRPLTLTARQVVLVACTRRAPVVAACVIFAFCLVSRWLWPAPLVSPACTDATLTSSGFNVFGARGTAADARAAARRWDEFRRCLTLRPAQCVDAADTELPASPPPFAELEAHFHELLLRTRPLRGLPMLQYAGWRGPWVENAWLAAAACADYRAFYPLVPLFVQVSDHVFSPSRAAMDRALLELVRTLRRDVIYLLVTEDDQGLGFLPSDEDCAARNILVLNSGGWGNVALPLIRGELLPNDFGGGPPPPPDERSGAYERTTLITFAGSLTTSIGGQRQAAAAALRAAGLASDALFRIFYAGLEWKAIVQNSVLSLSPRGFGRTSFRSSELVQLGVPQLYVYDEVPWLPYWDPERPDGRPGRTDVWGPNGLGLIASIDGLANVTAGLCAAMLPPDLPRATCSGGLPAGPPYRVHARSRIARMRARALELAGSHFTYNGFVRRIREFLDSPWDADLVCVKRPVKRQ